MEITVSSPIADTPRVAQIRGMFDLPEEAESLETWSVELPLTDRPWSIGLVVGPSGCGKSTIARHIWAQQPQPAWNPALSILDSFPESMPVKEVVEILSSVGFSSPPAWLRPFHVLSTGQKFRVELARSIADQLALGDAACYQGPIVFDEYTSVVDRTVAQVASAALSRTIRAKKLQFVAVTCHEDVEPWLQPDWVYRPAERTFVWRSLQRRPAINLSIFRCSQTAWSLFAPHHYLTTALNQSAHCFLATWNDNPVAFSAWLPYLGVGPPSKREHRTVTLPDYQGVGIGNALSATIASMWAGLGFGAASTTTHPAMIRSRCRSPLWRMIRSPNINLSNDKVKHAATRFTAGFRYIGSPMETHIAKALLAS